MPSEDFQHMSDRELSDVVAYIRAQPPVDHVVPPRVIGPILRVVIGTGQAKLPADVVEQVDHHLVEPPPEGPTVEYGAHIIGVCTGCHRSTLEGGPMAGAPPDWKTPANLTPSADGLAGWTYDDFAKVLKSGIRKDGTAVGVPMAMIVPYGANMTDTELHAMWAYLAQLPPLPDGA
jgi:mono/diheme cytochrome c family protein